MEEFSRTFGLSTFYIGFLSPRFSINRLRTKFERCGILQNQWIAVSPSTDLCYGFGIVQIELLVPRAALLYHMRSLYLVEIGNINDAFEAHKESTKNCLLILGAHPCQTTAEEVIRLASSVGELRGVYNRPLLSTKPNLSSGLILLFAQKASKYQLLEHLKNNQLGCHVKAIQWTRNFKSDDSYYFKKWNEVTLCFLSKTSKHLLEAHGLGTVTSFPQKMFSRTEPIEEAYKSKKRSGATAPLSKVYANVEGIEIMFPSSRRIPDPEHLGPEQAQASPASKLEASDNTNRYEETHPMSATRPKNSPRTPKLKFEKKCLRSTMNSNQLRVYSSFLGETHQRDNLQFNIAMPKAIFNRLEISN